MVGSFAIGYSARAASGHTAAPPSSVMKSRRLIARATRGIEDSFRLGLLPMAARYSLARWAHLR
jgi:hypothetical protein